MSRCDACGQTIGMERKRKITAAMAAGLIKLYNAAEGNTSMAVYTPRDIVVDHGGDFAKLRHWTLIEPAAKDPWSRKHVGHYRITENGVLFVKDLAEVPKYIWFVDGEPHHSGGGYIDIKHALGSRFDYSELLAV